MAMADKLVEGYIKLREKKADLAAKHAAEMLPIVEMMERIETALMTELNKVGAKSVATEFGTFFKKESTSCTVQDRATYLAWLTQTGNWDLADIRAAKVNIETYKEVNKDLPPGLNWSSEVKVHIRKGNKSGNQTAE